MASIQQQAQQEIAKRMLEQMHKDKHDSLYEFIQYYRLTEKKEVLDKNRHLELICNKLEQVYERKIKRLMINMPPRSFKTELVSIAYPARCLGKTTKKKFMDISYASGLAEENSSKCRAMYQSNTYKAVFPRIPILKADKNTKQHWENIDGWQYYAAGSTGTITWFGADDIIIDDPLKPDDAMSDTMRIWVNNNYHATIKSRLNDRAEWAIVIIMQRVHDDDLCGHLIGLEEKWGEKREKIVIKAIAEEDDEYRKAGESFFPKRFPIEILQEMKRTRPQEFSSQYQQEPVNKDTQEFHEEWFKYHWDKTDNPTPKALRVFTAVDPAFKQGQDNDNTAIITGWFYNDELYILELTAGKYSPEQMQDKIIYHIQKRAPEKVGIEAFQAQSMIIPFLHSELQKRRLYTQLEEIKQTWDKLSKIRKLVTLYRNWLIFHKPWMDDLEQELKRFPKWKHDDMIDALQMLYSLYELQPNVSLKEYDFEIRYGHDWTPIYW